MRIFGEFLTTLAVSIILGILLAFPVMLLWNEFLVPAVNGVHEIEWLQAWGLMILASILFKSNVSKAA